MTSNNVRNKCEFIFENELTPLSTVKHHYDVDCITRYFSKEFPVYTAIHKVINANKPEEYTELHTHDYDEINILIGDDENFKYNIRIDDESYIVGSNNSIFISKGKKHSANVISGSGYYIAIRLDNYIQK